MESNEPEKPLPLRCHVVAAAGCFCMMAMGVYWIVERQVAGKPGMIWLRGTSAVVAGAFVILLSVALLAVVCRERFLIIKNQNKGSDSDEV